MKEKTILKLGLIGSEGRLGKVITALCRDQIIPILRTTNRKEVHCDVIIDVSSPLALVENLSAEKPIVIGTTGHLTMKPIEEAAKKVPVFFAPNFSIGIALMKKMAILAAPYFPGGIDLVETHHKEKKDAPSGTALMLKEVVQEVKIESIRVDHVVGEHRMVFRSPHERLTITHEALSREAFAQGALAAAHFLIGKRNGLYGMDDLL